MSSKPTDEQLFDELYNAHTEEEIDEIINKYPNIFEQSNWFPLGANPNNYGVVENQQSSPIAALIEKVTNCIDATLLKKCKEAKIDPKSLQAPRTMDDAIKLFYSDSYKSWDQPSGRNKQAEEIQILADGPKMKSSLTIYDNGEGQHPDDIEDTFLSLLSGNKKEIMFVQGTYNMGGSGAIVFCGKKRYQLVASKKYDSTGQFGFTLVREHKLSREEERTKKNTWYEYFKIEGKIPRFDFEEKDLRLHNRKFKTGSVVKLYSYILPEGSRSVISRDLNQSLNEYIFQPALPILTVDRKDRYPKDLNLERALFGLRRRLEHDEGKYLEDKFTEVIKDDTIGTVKVSCYVFKSKIADKTVQETKDSIRREFFKNGMSVAFSINGQVHGGFTTEFITKSLKLNILRDYLLIHVDCTELNYSVRKELFMASRDRLKNGEETARLRSLIASQLTKPDSRLMELERRRRDSISVDSSSTKDLIKSFTKNFNFKSDLLKLLGNTFKLDEPTAPPKKDSVPKPAKDKKPFLPNRFPTYFKAKSSDLDELDAVRVPIGGQRTVLLESDIEDHYFDRCDEPGDFEVSLLSFSGNNNANEKACSTPTRPEQLFSIARRSPKDGTIRITFEPNSNASVGDAAQVKLTLKSPNADFDVLVWTKIVDKNSKNPPEENEKEDQKENDDNRLNLPEPILVYREAKEGCVTWSQVEEATGESMSDKTVMFPFASGDSLERIYVNMDSIVLSNFKNKKKGLDANAIEVIDKKYFSSVYFHTLFLYIIAKGQGFRFSKDLNGAEQDIDLGTFLISIFDGSYSEFILNFGGTNELYEMISAVG